MGSFMNRCKSIIYLFLFLFLSNTVIAQSKKPFHVIAFFTAKQDAAHISFVHEANKWFSNVASHNHFTYDSTNNWELLDSTTLSHYQLVIFLDTRPDSAEAEKCI